MGGSGFSLNGYGSDGVDADASPRLLAYGCSGTSAAVRCERGADIAVASPGELVVCCGCEPSVGCHRKAGREATRELECRGTDENGPAAVVGAGIRDEEGT